MSATSEHADHPKYLQHHFSTPQQQFSTAKLGMWLFLGQEILFFGGIFMAYGACRFFYPETFLEAHQHLDKLMGALNTVVLLASSLTMALAVRAAQTDNKVWLVRNLVLTLACAFIFLIVKYFEYSHKFHDGLLPGVYYTAEGIAGMPQIFFALYFMMTGLHAIHVIGGIVVIGWILKRSINDEFSSEYYIPVENVGLYWHLVDIIWIFLFPLLYLVK